MYTMAKKKRTNNKKVNKINNKKKPTRNHICRPLKKSTPQINDTTNDHKDFDMTPWPRYDYNFNYYLRNHYLGEEMNPLMRLTSLPISNDHIYYTIPSQSRMVETMPLVAGIIAPPQMSPMGGMIASPQMSPMGGMIASQQMTPTGAMIASQQMTPTGDMIASPQIEREQPIPEPPQSQFQPQIIIKTDNTPYYILLFVLAIFILYSLN